MRNQSPLAASLFQIMSCINRLNIPHECLEKSGLQGSEDKIVLTEAIGKFHNLSLVTITVAGSGIADARARTHAIHALVHIAIGVFQEIDERSHSLKTAARMLVKILPMVNFDNWNLWRISILSPCQYPM